MQKRLITILCIILFALPISGEAAQDQTAGSSDITIQVSGKGATKDAALQDAFRNAIERVFGAYVYSRTTVDKAVLTEDKIVVISKGFVKDYQIVFENISGDLYFLSVNVTISADKFFTFVRENKLDLWRDAIKDASLIQFTQEKLKKFSELLKTLIGEPKDILNNGYSLDVAGYLVDDIGVDYVKGFFLTQIAVNQEFWNNYMEIIRQMTTDTEHYINEGLLNKTKLFNMSWYAYKKDECFNRKDDIKDSLGIVNPVKVHKSLEPFLTQPIDVEVKVDKWGIPFTLYKNAIIIGRYKFFKYSGTLDKITDCIKYYERERAPLVEWGPYKYTQSEFRGDLLYKHSNELLYFSWENNFALVAPYVIIKIPFKLKDEQELKKLSFKNSINIKGINKGGRSIEIKSDEWVIH